MSYATYGQQPGLTEATTTSEVALVGGPTHLLWRGGVKLVAATVDAGNTPTTTIRAGNILGKVTASGLYTLYNPDATDGSEVPSVVLESAISMIGGSGSVEIKDAQVLFGGVLQAANLITGQDGGLDAKARRVLSRQFVFDDQLPAQVNGYRTVETATNVSVTAAQSGTLFVATAAATFTLPTIANDLEYEFLMTANANLAVTGAASTLLRDTSNVAGTTATFSTANQKLGASCKVRAIYVTGVLKWKLDNTSGFTITMT